MLLVKQSDATYRPVIEYRAINKFTRFDAEPIPNLEAIFAKLRSAKYLSKLDFTKGYWQIPMHEADKETTAFSTALGLVHFCLMPLMNAGATYSIMMRILLDKLPNGDNYIDDVLIHNETWKEHMFSLHAVFQRILNAGLTIKPSKCYIGYSAVSFGGHKIIQGKLQTRQKLTEKIAKASLPENIKVECPTKYVHFCTCTRYLMCT